MISVIIPVFNREKTLKKCIDSVISQSYRDFELILIDDGSTDSSPELCDVYEKRDDRIKVFHIQNSGVASARNFGLKEAMGEYISFVDSDDYIHRDYLLKLYNSITDNNCIMSLCNYSEILGEKVYPKIICSRNDYASESLIDDMLYSKKQVGFCWGKLFRRKQLTKFFSNYRYCEDVLFSFEYLRSNKGNVSSVSESLYYYIRHENSITGGKKVIDLYDSISVSEEIFDTCIKSHINHINSARANLVTNSIFAYLQTYNDKSDEAERLRKRVKMIVASNRRKVLFDKNATLKTKGACVLSLISYRALCLVYRMVK